MIKYAFAQTGTLPWLVVLEAKQDRLARCIVDVVVYVSCMNMIAKHSKNIYPHIDHGVLPCAPWV